MNVGMSSLSSQLYRSFLSVYSLRTTTADSGDRRRRFTSIPCFMHITHHSFTCVRLVPPKNHIAFSRCIWEIDLTNLGTVYSSLHSLQSEESLKFSQPPKTFRQTTAHLQPSQGWRTTASALVNGYHAFCYECPPPCHSLLPLSHVTLVLFPIDRTHSEVILVLSLLVASAGFLRKLYLNLLLPVFMPSLLYSLRPVLIVPFVIFSLVHSLHLVLRAASKVLLHYLLRDLLSFGFSQTILNQQSISGCLNSSSSEVENHGEGEEVARKSLPFTVTGMREAVAELTEGLIWESEVTKYWIWRFSPYRS